MRTIQNRKKKGRHHGPAANTEHRAHEAVTALRRGDTDPDFCIQHINTYLTEHPGDGHRRLRTTAEEITELVERYYLRSAKTWLVCLRNGNTDSAHGAKQLREDLARARKTLADIGTSEKQLASFLSVQTA
ncbi:MAG: hypothetical protein HGA67_03495 [Candidatus Yonathbacteria bacterium]|nr:hypothetical protein [Candidatus Yonathbacteria bacterium]